MARYELFSHPSEQGIRGYGETLEESFQEIAKALQSVMTDIERIEAKEEKEIALESSEKEHLLVKWLNELLYIFDVERKIFKEFEVSIEGNKLKAKVKGEKFNPDKHEPRTQIKAVTYNELKIEKRNKEWLTQCVVDV